MCNYLMKTHKELDSKDYEIIVKKRAETSLCERCGSEPVYFNGGSLCSKCHLWYLDEEYEQHYWEIL